MYADPIRWAALFRVRFCAAVLLRLARVPRLRPVLGRPPATRAGRRAAGWLLGFRRPFPSLALATATATRYLPSVHQTRTNWRQHLSFSRDPRISDYPVLFHLARIEGDFRVFDLGGNVGTLFYCLRDHLPNAGRMRWTVFDLPQTVRLGRRLARRRGVADRLEFADGLEAADGAEVWLASGALHYFERPLPEMLAALERRPAHVLVNRTPLNDGPSVATVQDAGFGLAACVIHDRHGLTDGMRALGYALVDQWSIHHMALEIPLYPALSAPFYSGLYFRRA
jgi:putative methyltransferase (TIGR04325 family)